MQPYGPAVLRLATGAVFVAHGAQKLFGMWGGGGLSETAGFFAQLGLTPAYPLAVVVGLAEFCGGLLLLLGALTLYASLVLVVTMLVAIWRVHLAAGFFLPNGYELNLALIGALVSLMLTGPGALSIDEQRARSAQAQAYGRARLRSGNV
jgi:putative oxidoreductase